MPFEFKFPDVGEGIQEGELKKWLVKEGDSVTADQHVAEVETDKAVVEMPAPKAGIIAKLHYNEGDVIQVGAVFITINEPGESAAAPSEPSQAPTKESSPSLTKSKPSKSPSAEKSGEKYTGSVVGFLEEAKEVTPISQQEAQAQKPSSQVKATLMVRRLAKEKGVDLSAITGTGHDGMITKEDVESAVTSSSAPPEASAPAKHLQAQPEERVPTQEAEKKTAHVRKYDFYGYLDRRPLKGMKKVIAEHMAHSMSSSPQATNFHWVDVTALEDLRATHKKIAAEKGIKLTPLAYIVKAVAKALPNHLELNAMMEEGEIVAKKYVNIGIAVDVDDGLMVPVIKRANTKHVEEIAQEIVDFAKKARDRKLDMMDMKGGTFTVSNLGSVGVEFFTPILNSPESALLGIGTTQEKPVAKNGQIIVRKMMPLSLTYDHRIVNGAQAARFVQDLKQYLEFPGMIDSSD